MPVSHRCHIADRGSVTVFTALMIGLAMLGAALALDIGQALTAKTDTIAQAQQAARSAVAALDTRRLRTGSIAVIHAAAIVDIQNYLHTAGDTGSAIIAGDTVTVTAHRTVTLRLLGLYGLGHKTVTGTGTARIEPGVNAPYDLEANTRPQGTSGP